METQVNDLNYYGENIFTGIDTLKKNWKVAFFSNDLAFK
jgi:hypothetical protein